MELHNSPQPFAQPSGWDADTALPTGEAGQGWGCVAPRRSDTSYSCSERSTPSAPAFPTPLRTASYTDEVGGESLGLRMASRPPPALLWSCICFVWFMVIIIHLLIFLAALRLRVHKPDPLKSLEAPVVFTLREVDRQSVRFS